MPEGIKPPLILIQFVAARLQTCAFIEKDKSSGIGILQGARTVQAGCVAYWGIDGVFWQGGNTHAHRPAQRLSARAKYWPLCCRGSPAL